MPDCEEKDDLMNMDPGGHEQNLENDQFTCSISGVDGLPSTLKKKKYRMVQHVTKEKGVQQIGSSRAEKVFVANVEEQLQSSICSYGCLKKLDARAVLMKRFRAWSSHEYKERASWILENLTDCYNKGSDKFET